MPGSFDLIIACVDDRGGREMEIHARIVSIFIVSQKVVILGKEVQLRKKRFIYFIITCPTGLYRAARYKCVCLS